MARDIVVDACSVLNLLATRREIAIVQALDLHLVVTPQVSSEALTLWTPPDPDGQRSREPTSTDALRQGGYLETRELEGDAVIDASSRPQPESKMPTRRALHSQGPRGYRC